MRVLVTGGAGFIGSHLADRLLSDGHDVAVVDDLSTGHREFVPEDAAFFEADIRDAAALERVFAEFRPDAVSHQAAHASVGRSVREPAYDADVNILGTIRVVEACRRHAVSRLVFASSGGAIYGEADRPVPEDSPLLPKSPYGMSKLAGEHYVRFFAEEGGGTAVVLRYANVFGPRQDSGGEGGVISIFGERMLAAAPSTIFGDGEQTRDFVFVADVVDANVRSLTADSAPGVHTFNVGTGRNTTVNEVAARVAAAVRRQRVDAGLDSPVPTPTHGPERPGDLRANVVDPSRISYALGWKPRADFDAGLRKTVAWLAEQPGQDAG